jgi:ADP-ribosylglycohydrolase
MTRSQYVGCLLGGAVGDALGAPVESLSLAEIRRRLGPAGVTGLPAPLARITDDTQMTLFTAEGLLRAHNQWREQGSAKRADLLHRAYLRWLETQGVRARALRAVDRDGWLASLPALRERRAPGHTCLSALESGRRGTVDEPINTSKGCGGVMRVAPVGLVCADPFEGGCEAAALTHGHPSGYLAAGVLAAVVAGCLKGYLLRSAIARATTPLKRYPKHRETLAAVKAAVALASSARPTPENVERLGQGWVAEEALAIALFCALTARSFRDGVLAAVNHSGDSDSTGAITGNILGAALGVRAIPRAWLARLELRDVVETVGDDIYRHVGSQSRRLPDDFDRYPPW